MTTQESTDDARHRRAIELQKEIFGGSLERDFSAWPAEGDLVRMWADVCYADSWARTALDMRTKSMLTIALLLATGSAKELLQYHVKAGLGLGISRDEMIDVFIHATAYCGIPSTSGTWHAVRDMIFAAADGEA